jgi:hypothetical protein
MKGESIWLKIQLEFLPSLVSLWLLFSPLAFPCLMASREGSRKEHNILTQDTYPWKCWSGFHWMRCEQLVMDGLECYFHSLDSLCLCAWLPANNSPAWLHHWLDMSPFLFVSFVTHRSACKVECNILLSLSSQVSTLLFRRKHGHYTLNSGSLQPKFTVTLL